MAAWTSRGMDKFLCEDFGLSSLNFMGKFVSSGKNVFKVAFLNENDKSLRIWRYNIKENLPWKELSSIHCRVGPFARVDISEVIIRGHEIFVFLRRHFGNILYEFVPIFDIKKESWTVPSYNGYRVPDLDNDSIYRGTCLVGDDFLIYSSASLENHEDFQASEHGGSNRYSDTQEIPPHENPIRFYCFNLSAREWRTFDTHMIGFKKADVHDIGRNFFGSALVAGGDDKSIYLFNERAFESTKFSHHNVAYKLDCEKREWHMVRVTGDIPDKMQPYVTLKGFVYMYGCSGEPSGFEIGRFDRHMLMSDILRFDPFKNHWEVIDAAGQRPEPRSSAHLLTVDDKIVVIGGLGGRTLARRRRKDEFWFRGNGYNLGCRCNYCWDMELTGEEDAEAFESDEEEEKERGVGVANKKGKDSGKHDDEETRACFDSATEFSHRQIAIGEEQVRRELQNNSRANGASADDLSGNLASLSLNGTASIDPPAPQTIVDASPTIRNETGRGTSNSNAPVVRAGQNNPDPPMPVDAGGAVDDNFEATLRDRFRNMPKVKLTKEEMQDVRFKFFFWQTRNDPLASPYFFDIHVLDLSPSLKTLALVSIADANPRLDTSYLPPNLHLNLNTMYAFDPEGKKMPALSESEWEMLVYGKGDFRWDVVKTLKEIGAYDGGIFKLFMTEKFLEREQV